MTFGERLKKLRNKRGLTQSELANKLQMSTSSIAMWETDSREPDMKMIVAISDYFNVTTDYLLGHDASDTNPKLDELLEKEFIPKFEKLVNEMKAILYK